MTSKNAYPEYISFTDAAKLLVRHGLAGSMTPQGLRYIARSRDTKSDGRWPFGNKPGQQPYLMAANTRLMPTEALLKHFRQHPPNGRGPDKTPRKRGGRQ